MSTPIKIRSSSTPGKIPTTGQLASGELAYNTHDGVLYAKRERVGIDTDIIRIGAGVTVTIQNITGSPVYPTFASNIGVSSIGISSEQFVFIPSTGSVGIGTINPTSKLTVGGDGYFSGNVKAPTFIGNLTGTATTSTNVIGGIGSLSSLSVSGVSTLDSVSASNINISGVATAPTFIGNLTGTATTATKLENSRTFEITGDIVAPPQNFDGSQNVSLASSIQPNTVGLGTHTYGDYVKNITGTTGEIEVSVTSGEGVSPQIGLPDNVTISSNLTVNQDVQINRNLNVNGNITIGGTSAYIIVNDFRVKDADIVLGFATDSYGNEVSNDITANHGGISVASTEGNPLVSIYNPGVGETSPPTYKKIMWFKSGSFVGLNTDAWLINYAVGIGSTQFPSGTRLAAGSVQFTENDLAVVRNINASGIVTANTFRPSSGYIQAPDGTNSFYIYSGTGNVAFQGTIGASQINNASGYKVIGFAGTDTTFENNVRISGVTTLGTVQISSGIVTATSGVVTYYGDGSKLTGVTNGVTIQNGGSPLGAATTINFSPNLIATFASGIATITALPSTVSISTDASDTNQFIPYTTSFGSTTGFGATNNFVFNPSTGNLGIGTTNPQVKLEINGVLGFGTFISYSIPATNIRIGDSTTGSSITLGDNNLFIGIGAGHSSTTARSNNFLGKYSGHNNTSGSHNNYIGYGAGYGWYGVNSGNNNNFIGRYSGASIRNGSQNNFLGYFAGYRTTNGYENNFIGDSAGNYNTTGSNNNFFGYLSGNYNTTGSYNTFLGSYTGISTSASNKIVFGRGFNSSNLFDSPSTSKDNQFAVGLRTDTNPSKYWLVGDENFNIGIGTTNPTQRLHVQGNVRITGGLYDSNNNVGTAGSVLSSTGSGLSWIAAASGGGGSVSISTNTTNSNQFIPYTTSFGSTTGFGATNSFVFNPSTGNLGIATTNPQVKLDVNGGSKLKGVFETVSTATTYLSGSTLVLEVDAQQATSYTYTIPNNTNIGIVSFRNVLSQTGISNATTLTLILTQNTAGTGNTTSATGIGTNVTIVGYENGSAVSGISTRSFVGSGTTVTLSSTGNDVDFISFFIHYNGGSNISTSSYKVYVTKNGNFR